MFYACEKGSIEYRPLPVRRYEEHKKVFLEFVDYNKGLVSRFNKNIEGFDGDVYMFGAHIFSQYLLHAGLNRPRIKGILDNSVLKQGKRLYGFDVFLEKPQVIRGLKKVGVILKVGAYREEVMKQLLSINPSVVFFE